MQVVFPDTESVVLVPDPRMDDDQFFDFCMENPDVRIERTSQGDIVIMPPTGGETGDQKSEIIAQLRTWAKLDGRGRGFDCNTGFTLPNGAVRSSDAAWVRKDWIEKLTKRQKQRFLPLRPDFVIELTSPSDPVSKVASKMREWVDNGAELAWMIDPASRTITIYRPGCEPQELSNPDGITGEGPVAGFRLELSDIWAGI